MLLKVAPTIQVVAKGWGQKGIIISTEFNWMTTKPSPLDWQEDLYGGRLAKQVHASMIVFLYFFQWGVHSCAPDSMVDFICLLTNGYQLDFSNSGISGLII